ncbi:prophage LambdaSa03, minor structural protein [Streptococcus agalactiae]|nr:prophage LambdaSa03, minor structural protein [Streptococcus agalactiae]
MVIFGDTLNVNINQSSSGFTYDVRYNVNGITGVVASNITGSTTFKTSLDWASTIPNATSTPGTIYVDTKSNGSSLGRRPLFFI